METVASKNMSVVWAVNPHFTHPPLARLEGSNIPPIHWKNRTITIPRMIDRADEVNADGLLPYHKA